MQITSTVRPRPRIGTQEYPANPALDNWSKTAEFDSIPDFFRAAVEKNPDGDYVGAKVDGEYQWRSYREVQKQVDQFSSALIEAGIQPGDRIGIYGQNSPDGRVATSGILQSAAVFNGLLPEYPEERVEFVLQNANARMVMVDSPERLQAVLNRENALPDLETIVVTGDVDLKEFKSSKNLVSFQEMLDKGAASLEKNREEMDKRVDGIRYDDIACLVYTSGSSGTPKGVLVSHGNVLSSVTGSMQVANDRPNETLGNVRFDDTYPSVLPQGHVMGQVAEYVITAHGGRLAYPASLKEFTSDLSTLKPTVLAVTPLFLHKIYEGIEEKAMANQEPVISPKLAGLGAGAAGGALGAVAGGLIGAGIGGQALTWGLAGAGFALAGAAADAWATKFAEKMTGAEVFQSSVNASKEFYQAHGDHTIGQRIKHELAKKFVWSKAQKVVNERTGGQIRTILSGGAPLATEAETAMRAMGFKIAQGYGLAESSGGGMMNNPARPELGTGGAAHPGTELRIGEGEEIQMRGPTIMTGGYLNRPDKTSESFTEDGWYRTGDTGKIVKATGPVSPLKLAGLTALGSGAGGAVGAALGNPLLGAAVGGVLAGTATIFTGLARTEGQDHFAITGRMKSQFKLPGGEYVTPEPIEASLQGSPYIARSLVVGDDSRDLVGALIQPNFETLTAWAKDNNVPTEPKEMVKDPKVLKLYSEEAVNRSSNFRKHEVVRRVALLDHELSGDAITSKGEVMRKVVTENYKEQLDGMFN